MNSNLVIYQYHSWTIMQIKHIILPFYLFFALSPYLSDKASIDNSPTESQDKIKVWICTGSSAYTYHSRSNCSGMNNCKSSIKQVTLDEAVKKYHRRPCKKCWRGRN